MFIGLVMMVAASFVNYLLKLPKGVKPIVRINNENGARALCNAAIKGRASLVYTLLSVGMDVNSKDSNGNVPLILAAANGHADTVKLLLDHGADVNVKGSEGKNALMRAAEAGYSQTALLLRHAGAKE
jgi:hypothetical protein